MGYSRLEFEYFRSNFVNNPRKYVQFWYVNDNLYEYIIYDLGSRLNDWGDNIPYVLEPYNETTEYGQLAEVMKPVVHLRQNEHDTRGNLQYTPTGNLLIDDEVHTVIEPKITKLF